MARETVDRGKPLPGKEGLGTAERIRAIHAASDEIYGSPNIHAELCDPGTRV
jgi:hypothetical protein